MRQKKLTSDIEKNIIDLYVNGLSSLEVSKILNISQTSISKVIKNNGVTRNRNTELFLNKELQDDVKNMYIKGYSSIKISIILNIPKHNILYFLRKENLLRDRYVDESNYKEFWFENGKWYGYRLCPKCDDKVLCYAQKEYLLLRNINSKIKKGCLCKKCYSETYSGTGNNFYGKKHSEYSIKKMLVSQNKVIKPISKNEYVILNILKEKLGGVEIITQFVIENKSYDFFIPKLNLVIEYNGDYWHCNPKIYSNNYFNKKKNMYAQEIWEYDKHKLQLCEKYNYTLEVIWEDDFKCDNDIVNKIIKKYVKTTN